MEGNGRSEEEKKSGCEKKNENKNKNENKIGSGNKKWGNKKGEDQNNGFFCWLFNPLACPAVESKQRRCGGAIGGGGGGGISFIFIL